MAVLDETMGVLLIGVIIASVLYGCTCVQTWFYFTHYPSDRWYLKLVVLATFLSDTGHEASIAHYIYTYLVTDYADWAELHDVVISLVIQAFLNGFTALLVQCFMAVRVYTLSNKNWFATGLVSSLVLFQWILILIFSTKSIPLRTYAEFATINSLSMSVNASAAAGDTVTTICLCYLLQKSRTGFRRSDWTINKLTMFSITTGLLTSLCALGSLISISIWPHTFIYILFYFSIGRLYCNSLLATLNARKGLRKGATHEDLSLFQTVPVKSSETSFTSSKRATNNIPVKIDTTQDYIGDGYALSTLDLRGRQVV